MRFMREALRRDAQLAIGIAAAEAKRIYDGKYRQVEDFNVGDKVWLTLGKQYKTPGTTKCKTTPKREGPYEITRKVTPLAYELKLPVNSKIHPVISVQYLTLYNCDDDPFQRRLPLPGPLQYHEQSEYSDDSEEVYEIERIVNHRPLKGKPKEYLVRWQGYGPKDVQWRTVAQLKYSRELIEEYHERLKAQQ